MAGECLINLIRFHVQEHVTVGAAQSLERAILWQANLCLARVRRQVAGILRARSVRILLKIP